MGLNLFIIYFETEVTQIIINLLPRLTHYLPSLCGNLVLIRERVLAVVAHVVSVFVIDNTVTGEEVTLEDVESWEFYLCPCVDVKKIWVISVRILCDPFTETSIFGGHDPACS